MENEKEFGFAIHEIKNKLQVLLLNSEILERYLKKLNIKDENVIKFTNRMKNESLELYKFILNISYVFKKENNAEEFSFYGLLNEIIDNYRNFINKKKIEIRTNYDLKIKNINQDRRKLSIIMGNIIKNSLELESKKNEVIIRTEKKKDKVKITIINYGEKIDEKLQKKIFKAGFSTKEEGSGLGLFIVKDLLKDIHGTIEIRSSEESTRFIISFPDNIKNK